MGLRKRNRVNNYTSEHFQIDVPGEAVEMEKKAVTNDV